MQIKFDRKRIYIIYLYLVGSYLMKVYNRVKSFEQISRIHLRDFAENTSQTFGISEEPEKWYK